MSEIIQQNILTFSHRFDLPQVKRDFVSSIINLAQRVAEQLKSIIVLYHMGVLKHFALWDIFWSEGIERFSVKIFQSIFQYIKT